jgi:hypothetical protein
VYIGPKLKVRLPHTRAEWVHKGEHTFHSSYLAAEAVLGHGILAWLALGGLICVILAAFIHEA